MNKGSRYHPEEACWFKTKDTENEKANHVRNVNSNSVLEVDLNTDKKKLEITPLIKIKLLIEDKLEVSGVYDSGSQISLINSRLIKVKEKIENVNTAYMKTVNGVKKTDGLITIKIKIFEIEEEMDVYIIKEEDFDDFIIGLDMIKKFRLTQNENLKIEQKNKPHIKTLKNTFEENSDKEEDKDSKMGINSINFNEHIQKKELEITIDHLVNQKKNEIWKIIEDYKTIFAKDKYDIGTVNDYEADIDLLVDKYCSKRPYICTIEDKKEIEEQISILLKRNLIEESYSPFAAPVTLAYKKDDKNDQDYA